MARRPIIWIFFFAVSFAFFCRLQAAETRALWVTRWEYRSPDDIRMIVDNAAATGFNTLLLQVRGNGTVNYPSQLEIWSEEFGFVDPGWDPLRLAIDLGHAHGLAVHAWLNVYPGWKKGQPPDHGGQLYHIHPDWFVVDCEGKRFDHRAEYLWLSPTHPQVTDHLIALCRELLQNYDLDGLHFDYIRYPSPEVSFDETSVNRFRLLTGSLPNEVPEKWTQWRQDAISDFLTRLAADVVAYQPKLVVSAAVQGDYFKGLRVHLQDSHAWLAKGLIDVLYPMIYINEPELFGRQLLHHRQNDHGRHIYPGIYMPFGAQAIEQIEIARRLGCEGMAMLSYKALFPDHQPNALAARLRQNWPDMVKPSELPWKETRRDNRGPLITQVQTVPGRVNGETEFRIAARVIDPSGIFDDDTGSDGFGVYLIYDRTWPPTQAREIKMSRVKNSDDWYVTDRSIPPQHTGLDFRCRIFAWDNYHESAKHPKRNLGYSDVWSLSILTSDQTFISCGTLGPMLWRPQSLAIDGEGKIWIATEEGTIVVLHSDGREADFSPLTVGWSANGQPVPFQEISSLSFFPPNIMLAATGKVQQLIFRFGAKNGELLPGIELDFTATAIDCDEKGHIFALEDSTTRFHVLDPTGADLAGSPFGTHHVGNDIAVLHNASKVLISDQSNDAVQCWQGAVEGKRARYWQTDKLPAVDVGLGKVVTTSNDWIYVPHTPRGIISIFDRTGRVLEYLSGGTPPLNAPRDIAISMTGDSLYVLEMPGEGSNKLRLWSRKRKAEETDR
ncbi:MAG TPA: family 10 glycosylhydrolase [bacterium]|nr:family 10 glycosylhydrolase [bacterium]HNT65809.1 family 10 glycosylhydrolase [bacterium]HOX85685.1 family 10 glycosylhydrolase [bacterium]HPG44844.1 family 10 glycosylhydrolase [bacterium]HPM98127.1 family 10 glycosylhydrolase [bacterium]